MKELVRSNSSNISENLVIAKKVIGSKTCYQILRKDMNQHYHFFESLETTTEFLPDTIGTKSEAIKAVQILGYAVFAFLDLAEFSVWLHKQYHLGDNS